MNILTTHINKLARAAAWRTAQRISPAPIAKTVDVAAAEDAAAGHLLVIDEPAVIEPQHGYVITRRGRLIDEALQVNGTWRLDPLRHAMPPQSARRAAMRATGCDYPAVVSLRHLWDWNYYHFLVDVIGRIPLLDATGIDPAIPLLLGKYARQVPFVGQIIARGRLAGRRWIVQEDEPISADRIILPHASAPSWTRLMALADLLDAPAGEGANRRVYLTRGASSTRRLANEHDLMPVLAAHGFETIDSAEMSVDEQIRLFSETRHLVAVHGAGLTNMAFRRGRPLTVIELQPDRYAPGEFGEIAAAFGFEYRALVGTSVGPDGKHADFTISPDRLNEALGPLPCPPRPSATPP